MFSLGVIPCQALEAGATPTPSIVDDSLDTLEHFVVLLYDRTSSHEHVNDARKQLFTKKGRAIDALPPT